MLLDPSEVLDHLRSDVYVRLRASGVAGIGAFALRPIPEGVDPFQQGALGLQFLQVPVASIMEDPKIPDGVKAYVNDLCACNDGMFTFPRLGLNGVTTRWYVNHSATPNTRAVVDPVIRFETLRAIEEGEELTVDYDSYNDDRGF